MSGNENTLMDRIDELEDTLHILTVGLHTVHAGDHLNGGARMSLAAMSRGILNKGHAEPYEVRARRGK